MSARKEAKRREKMARRKAEETERRAAREAAPPLIGEQFRINKDGDMERLDAALGWVPVVAAALMGRGIHTRARQR